MKRFARLVIRNEAKIFGGPSTGTTYDLTRACKRCGTGAEQVGPLFLSKAQAPKRDLFSILTHELLVSPSLEDALRRAGVESFGEVLEAGSHRKIPFSQLMPQGTLPPFSQGTTGFTRYRPCPVCNRDGHFDDPETPVIIKYSCLREEMLSSDVLATFERFGLSALRDPFADSVFASPLYLAGERVLDVLESERVKGIDFEPVTFS